jgi:hypothetical protein
MAENDSSYKRRSERWPFNVYHDFTSVPQGILGQLRQASAGLFCALDAIELEVDNKPNQADWDGLVISHALMAAVVCRELTERLLEDAEDLAPVGEPIANVSRHLDGLKSLLIHANLHAGEVRDNEGLAILVHISERVRRIEKSLGFRTVEAVRSE